VSLDLFIITAFCRIDDTLKTAFNGQRFRQRGPMPALWDAGVLTLEVVGEYLGFTQDLALYRYFRRHYTHFFPALARVRRTTFTRQSANLWKVKELVWQRLLDSLEHDPTFALVDSFPLPVCQFARAYRCRRFRRGGGFWQGYPGPADLLRLSSPCPLLLARCDYPIRHRTGQRL
jgi:hypothetical protein